MGQSPYRRVDYTPGKSHDNGKNPPQFEDAELLSPYINNKRWIFQLAMFVYFLIFLYTFSNALLWTRTRTKNEQPELLPTTPQAHRLSVPMRTWHSVHFGRENTAKIPGK